MPASPRRKTPRPARRYAALVPAAEYSGFSVKTLRRRIADGSITGFRAGPKLIMVDLDEIDALIRPIAAAARDAG